MHRLFLQSGFSHKLLVINNYEIQRQENLVFLRKQELGMEMPSTDENYLELILRLPTTSTLFLEKARGAYTHAIAKLCGFPVLPHMVSVKKVAPSVKVPGLQQVIDVKFGVQSPGFLNRKRVMGLLGDAADVQYWQQIKSVPADMDAHMNHFCACTDPVLIEILTAKIKKRHPLQRRIALSEDEVKKVRSLVFEREYVQESEDAWWVCEHTSQIAAIAREQTVVRFDKYDPHLPYSWASTNEGQKALFHTMSSKLSNINTENDNRLENQWDDAKFVTTDNVNFSQLVDYCNSMVVQTWDVNVLQLVQFSNAPLSEKKNLWLKFAPRSIRNKKKKQMMYLHVSSQGEDDGHKACYLRQKCLTATNMAIESLKDGDILPSDAQYLQAAYLAFVNHAPGHWKGDGTQWMQVSGVNAMTRLVASHDFQDVRQALQRRLPSTGSLNPVISIDPPASQQFLQNDFCVEVAVGSSKHYFVQVLDIDNVNKNVHNIDTLLDEFDTLPDEFDKLNSIDSNMTFFKFATKQRIEADGIRSSTQDLLLDAQNDASTLHPFYIVMDSAGNSMRGKNLLKSDFGDMVNIERELSPKIVDCILLLMAHERDFAYTELKNGADAKTLLFDCLFFTRFITGQSESQMLAAFSRTKFKLSDYQYLIFPVLMQTTACIAYVDIASSKIIAFSVKNGERAFEMEDQLRRFTVKCLGAEGKQNLAQKMTSVPLRPQEQQKFYSKQNWLCAPRHINVMMLAFLEYLFDGNAFDFEPHSTNDMYEFRYYFYTQLLKNSIQI